ncbi:hypothetical protein HJD18_15640 [Thermoleophilia bacterium SCSIO 60948]|nr:hypothetical protein HJD18_15640 [Thermoleophilia bacterium SCSIO 60948]
MSARRVQLGLLLLEARAGLLELGLAGGDLVAGRADPLDRLGGLATQVVDAREDRIVLVGDLLQVVVALHHVVEAVGLEDHGDRVRLIGLVDLDEALSKRLAGDGEALLEPLEAGLLGLELGPYLGEAISDDGLLVAELGDPRGEGVDLGRVLLDLRGQYAGFIALLPELGLLRIELGLQVLGLRAAGGQDDRDRGGEYGRQDCKRSRARRSGYGWSSSKHGGGP